MPAEAEPHLAALAARCRSADRSDQLGVLGGGKPSAASKAARIVSAASAEIDMPSKASALAPPPLAPLLGEGRPASAPPRAIARPSMPTQAVASNGEARARL